MQKYNFLYNHNADLLMAHATDVTIHPYGVGTDLLSSDDNSTTMEFVGMYNFENTDPVMFKYKPRKRPNARWPWPFRNWPSAQTVVVEGAEVRSYETDELLFRIPVDGIPHYLRPGDTLSYSPGAITIRLTQ